MIGKITGHGFVEVTMPDIGPFRFKKVGVQRMNRRVKVVSLRMDDVVDLLTSPDTEFITRLRAPGLPNNCEVISVASSWERRCIDVMVSHPSFPEVAEGSMLPREDLFAEVYKAARVRDDADLPVYAKVCH